MVAVIVVEDGTGLSDANSYISAATGNEKLAEIYLLMGLTEAPTLVDIDCIAGTAATDQRNGSRWKGIRLTDTQALDFPRVAVVVDGYELDSDVLPVDLETGTALAAYYAKTEGATLIADQATPGGIKSTSKKVAVVEKSIEYIGSASQQKQYTLMDQYISNLIESITLAGRGS